MSHSKRRYLAAGTLAIIGLRACGSSSSSAGPGSAASTINAPSPSSASTSSTGRSAGESLTVTGSLSLALVQSVGTHGRCTPGAAGASGPAANITGTLDFDNGTAFYALQFSLAPGVHTFPTDAGKDLVAFYPGTDSTKEWSIGTNVSKTQSGTVTFSAKHSTVDVEMAPDPPEPNPSLKPIHVRGTFACP